jgi:hypothetical protein
MPPAVWLQHVSHVVAAETQRRDARIQKAARHMLGFREEYAFRPEIIEAQRPGRQQFMQLLNCRDNLLTTLLKREGRSLSDDQKKLLDVMVTSVVLKIYGGNVEEYMRDVAFLKDKLYSTALNDAAAVIFPRRHGKTYTLSAFVAMVMLSAPKGNVVSYNMTFAHARTFMDECIGHMMLLKDHELFGWDEINRNDGKFIIVRQRWSGAIVTLKVYGNCQDARSAERLRGTGNNAMVICCDEGLFFHVAAYGVIVPVVANGAALIIASSSPAFNAVALNLLKAKDKNGNPVLLTLDWRPLCRRCEQREKLTQKEVTCRHGTNATPFRSHSNTRRLEDLSKPFGTYERESLNIRTGVPPRPYFDEAALDALFGSIDGRLAPTVPLFAGFQEHVPSFLLSIDTGDGQSDTVLISAAYTSRASSGDPLLNEGAAKYNPVRRYCAVRTHTHTCIVLISRRGAESRGVARRQWPSVPARGAQTCRSARPASTASVRRARAERLGRRRSGGPS